MQNFRPQCNFLRLAAGAAKVTCPNVLNSRTKIYIIGRVALLVIQFHAPPPHPREGWENTGDLTNRGVN